MYTYVYTWSKRVIWPATFARSAGPPGGGRTYNINNKYIYIYIDGGAPVVRLGGLAPARPIIITIACAIIIFCTFRKRLIN